MIIFGSQLWDRPDDYEPPSIHHDDPLVMEIAKTIMNAGGEYDWDYQMDGAKQGDDGDKTGQYYAEPYRHTINQHIKIAIEVRKMFP